MRPARPAWLQRGATPARGAALARGATLALALTAQLAIASPAVRAAIAPPRTSLPAVESQVMCVTCKIPLTVAQSPQADRERAYIQGLIDTGQDEAQIKRALVSQYGPQVLALPRAQGFDLAAYLVPLAAVALVLALLAWLLPKWRRQARAAASASAATGGPTAHAPPALDAADAARLREDLARHDL